MQFINVMNVKLKRIKLNKNLKLKKKMKERKINKKENKFSKKKAECSEKLSKHNRDDFRELSKPRKGYKKKT